VSETLPAGLIDDLVRRESARVVGMLVRMLGSVDRAEETFRRASSRRSNDGPWKACRGTPRRGS
jgi:predicted RNA polymerase sigma factor